MKIHLFLFAVLTVFQAASALPLDVEVVEEPPDLDGYKMIRELTQQIAAAEAQDLLAREESYVESMRDDQDVMNAAQAFIESVAEAQRKKKKKGGFFGKVKKFGSKALKTGGKVLQTGGQLYGGLTGGGEGMVPMQQPQQPAPVAAEIQDIFAFEEPNVDDDEDVNTAARAFVESVAEAQRKKKKGGFFGKVKKFGSKALKTGGKVLQTGGQLYGGLTGGGGMVPMQQPQQPAPVAAEIQDIFAFEEPNVDDDDDVNTAARAFIESVAEAQRKKKKKGGFFGKVKKFNSKALKTGGKVLQTGGQLYGGLTGGGEGMMPPMQTQPAPVEIQSLLSKLGSAYAKGKKALESIQNRCKDMNDDGQLIAEEEGFFSNAWDKAKNLYDKAIGSREDFCKTVSGIDGEEMVRRAAVNYALNQ